MTIVIKVSVPEASHLKPFATVSRAKGRNAKWSKCHITSSFYDFFIKCQPTGFMFVLVYLAGLSINKISY